MKPGLKTGGMQYSIEKKSSFRLQIVQFYSAN